MKGLSLLFVFFFLCACAPYLEQSRPALEAYYRGEFKQSAILADKIHPRGEDKLLSYLDKGTIYHSAGEFKKSIKYFEKAIDLSERLKSEPFAMQVGSIFANDNILPYVSGQYEKILMYTYQIINYSEIGDYEGALVEIRRLNTLFENIENPFTLYLSGLIWEANRLCNDALIDYKKISKLKSRSLNLTDDISRTERCAGFKNSAVYSGGKEPKAQNLIVIFEAGRAPEKVSSEGEFPFQLLPVPVYKDFLSNIKTLQVKVDGKNLGNTVKIDDIGDGLKKELNERMAAILARAAARLAAKEAAAIVVGEKVDQNLGLALSLLGMATNRADLRSWRTLPENLQIWRGNVAPGAHTISLEILDIYGKTIGQSVEKIDFKDGKTVMISKRSIDEI